MHILILSPTPSFPTDQGNRARIANVCQKLSDSGAIIHFLYFPREWGGRFSRPEYDGIAAQWDYFDVIPPSKDFVYETKGDYFLIDDWWDENIANQIKWKISDFHYDAFIVNYAFLSKAFEYMPKNTLKILDTHDRLSNRREMLGTNGVPPEFFYTSVEEEKIALDRADIVIAIAESEAKFFRSITDRKVITIGHVAEPQVVERNARSGPLVFGFLGSQNSINVRNLQNFSEHYTKLKPSIAESSEIHVYGACADGLDYTHLHPSIKKVGRVEKVESFYTSVDCIVVPFLFGTGQKIKVIEALSYGIPIICTESASDGTFSEHSQHLYDSFDGVIDGMRKFAGSPLYRKESELNSAQAFTVYASLIDQAFLSLIILIRQRRATLALDQVALHRRFASSSRADVIDTFVGLIATLDALSCTMLLTNKNETLQKIRLASRLLLQNVSEPMPKQLDESELLEDSGVIIAIGGCQPSKVPIDNRLLINLNIGGVGSYDGPKGFSAQIDVQLRNSWHEPVALGEFDLIQVLPIDLNLFSEYRAEAILFLVDEFSDSHQVLMMETMGLLARRSRTSVKARAIDAVGQIAYVTAEAVTVVHPSGQDAYRILLDVRSEAMSKRSVAVNLGQSFLQSPYLHKILAADCGPMISAVSRIAAPFTLDGEIQVRGAEEMASQLAVLLSSKSACRASANQWRQSCSDLVSLWSFSSRLRQLTDDKRKAMSQTIFAALR